MRISTHQAAEKLKQGEVVGLPTETVYGLAASLYNPDAIRRIFEIKGRPNNNPLIVHIAEMNDLLPLVKFLPAKTGELAQVFWPGPMTLVMPIMEELIPFEARAGLPTAAFRIPSHPLAQDVLRLTGPLVMPSANTSGRPSSTHPDHVEEDFGTDFPVVDGGACSQGVESTILISRDNHWSIIRLGALSPMAFENILGHLPPISDKASDENQPICPGQMHRHYAPRARLTLVKELPKDAKGIVLGYSERNYPIPAFFLGSLSNPEQVAHNLYVGLRRLDQEGIFHAWVDIDVPSAGLWLTIAERLARAAQR